MTTTNHAEHMTGAELQTLREACNLSREELASLAGVQARTVKHWENGRAGVPGDVAALVLGLDAMILKTATQAGDAIKQLQNAARPITLRRVGEEDSIFYPAGAPADLVLLRYHSAEDLDRYRADMAGLPASVHAAIVGRVRLLAQALGVPARVVWFDAEAYEAWRAVAKLPDTETTRTQWAAGQVATQALPHRADQPPG